MKYDEKNLIGLSMHIMSKLQAGEDVTIPGLVRFEVRTIKAGPWAIGGGQVKDFPERKRIKPVMLTPAKEVFK